MSNNTPSLSIGLLDNGCHSLQRGYELWYKGQTANDGWLLKEAVFWIHHGIELALKHLLVQTNEYLVFDRVDDAVRKLARLRRQPEMNTAGVLDLFDQDESGINSVSFHNLIQRTALMLNLSELGEGAPLRSSIDELTKYRNKIVHFSVKMNVSEVASLLSDILEPLLQLLAKEVQDTNFVNNCIPEIRRQAQPVRSFSRAFEEESMRRIQHLLQRFNGQHVSGELLGVDGDIVLPIFADVAPTGPRDMGADIKAEGFIDTWFIEIKTRLAHSFIDRTIEYLDEIIKTRANAKAWLIVMNEVSPSQKERIKNRGFMVSSLDDIVKLQQLLSQ